MRFGWPLLVLLGASAGCAPSDGEARGDWLQTTLVADNLDLLNRNPAAVAEKFAKMSAGPYAFFRGTLGQYLRDLQVQRQGRGPLLDDRQSAEVMLVGDPHPENIGSFRPVDRLLTVDFNDFDAARFGPFHFDLRRLALAFWALTLEVPALDEAELQSRLSAELSRAYVEEILAEQDGAPRLRLLRGRGHGQLIEDLLRRALRDGSSHEERLQYLEGPGLKRGIIEPRIDERVREDELVDIEPDARRWVDALLTDYGLSRGQSLLLIDGARQLGQGVSSYAIWRFLLLVDVGDGDSHLLELKEARDAPFLRAPEFPPRQFADNAERVIGIQRRLQTGGVDDPFLGTAATGAFSVRIREETAYQKSIRVSRIGELIGTGELVPEDLVAFARVAGRLLAAAHAGGLSVDGQPALPLIAAALVDRRTELVEAVVAATEEVGPRLAVDHRIFLERLERDGPLLGYRAP